MTRKKKESPPVALDRVMRAEAYEVQRMTSLEIAEVSGKNHKDVMRAIRKMEPAWGNVTGRKFALSEYKDSTGRRLPCYSLTKNECIYIATKFNDEARARLVLRWDELERWYQDSLRKELECMKDKHKCLIQSQAELQSEILELEPLAEYCKEALQSVSSFTVRTIAHSLKMTPQELNKILCAAHIQFGRSGRYTPYAKYARKGFTRTKAYRHRHEDGTVTTERRTTWTELGIRFIIELVEGMRRHQNSKNVVVQLSLNFV